ncbi:hypothetical protein ACFP2T_09090 [Plantactinospora solaniradicis]|uniref:Lipoprotein n=1 Tax=Plantactinospora solaniradicis TaxID=1723736 RepID=A0ABW1K3R2_9ACTN
MRRLLAVPILLCGLLGPTVACTRPADPGIPSANGSSAGASGSPAASDDPNAAANFAKCMREHGQNVPDPDPASERFDIVRPSGAPNSAWDAAARQCQHFLPGGTLPGPGPSREELEQLRLFAVCMREHGIEISDPEMPGEGTKPGNMVIRGRLEHLSRTEVQNDPGYKAAHDACEDKLPRGQKKEEEGR